MGTLLSYLALAFSVTVSPTLAPAAPAVTFLHSASPSHASRGSTCWGFHRWDFVRPLPSGMHPGPCSRLPLGLHCGFCCQFLTGGLLYQWASREIVPNCPATQPLSLGECVVPVLEHLQIMEVLLLWNEVMGRKKVKIFKKGSQMEFGILDCILEQRTLAKNPMKCK